MRDIYIYIYIYIYITREGDKESEEEWEKKEERELALTSRSHPAAAAQYRRIHFASVSRPPPLYLSLPLNWVKVPNAVFKEWIHAGREGKVYTSFY